MARSIPEYFEERQRECERLSLVPNTPPTYAVEAGSDGKRGRILMVLNMTERAYLQVSETVVIRKGNHVHREEYAYYLIIDGQEYRAWDLDAIHGYHGHTAGHKRIAGERVTFKQAGKEAWEIVGREEELTGSAPGEEAN